ncbi:nuclease harbi1, partial [Plakobranchus ocellatus]
CDKEDGSNENNMHSFNDYQEFQILKKKKCSGLLRAILTSSLGVEVEERATNNQAQGADVAISAADVASASNSDSKAVQVDFACSDNVRHSIEKKILQKEVDMLLNQKEHIEKTPGKESGFLELLNPILADREFPIKDILASKQVKLVMPPFLGNREKFTPEEELLTRQIAKDRIHVERAIERLKRFRILKHQVNSQLDSMISQIVFVVACLVNFL